MSGVQAVFNNLNKVESTTLIFKQGKGHDAGLSVVGSDDSTQGAKITTGTINAGGVSNWEFDSDTGVLTISNELKSGWVRFPVCTVAGGWGTAIRDCVKSVVLNGRFSKIDANAFYGYPLLESITLTNDMNTQFDNNSFANCPKLTEIKFDGDAYIPGAVDLSRTNYSTSSGHPVNTLADKDAFSGSTSVKTIILNNFYKDEEWRRLNKDTLPVNLETIMGPANSTYLREFCAANEYNFVPYGKIGEGTAWTYDEATKTVTIYGDGTGSALGALSTSDVAILEDAENLVIRGDITSIADGAFAGLTDLKTVTMKGNAPTVPDGAKLFGENDIKISVYKHASGFGETWCGYKVSILTFDPGDVNFDGEINAIDAVLLAQYIANWDVTVDKDTADCNGDGTINATDAVLLAQYLAGWDVTLGGDTPPTPDPNPDPDPDPDDGEDNEVDADDVLQ